MFKNTKIFLLAFYLSIMETYAKNAQSISCTQSDDFSGIPRDCRKFYRCSNGEFIELECAPGTLFDNIRKICDFPANVKCAHTSPIITAITKRHLTQTTSSTLATKTRVTISTTTISKILATTVNKIAVKEANKNLVTTTKFNHKMTHIFDIIAMFRSFFTVFLVKIIQIMTIFV